MNDKFGVWILFGWFLTVLLGFGFLCIKSLAALFEPLGHCAELLNQAVVKPLLSSGMEMALKYAEGLQETSFKEKVPLIVIAA